MSIPARSARARVAIACGILVVAGALGMPVALPAQASDAASLVKQAAELYAREVRGVVGFRSVTESQIAAPLFNRKMRSEAFVVQKDGIPVQVVMRRLLTDGKDEPKDQLASQESKTNAGYREGKGFFKAPYDPRYLDAYAFALEDCTGCAAGMTAVRFTSPRQDDQHGKGVMILDAAKRVREVRYSPNVLPPNVTQGSLALTRDEVADDLLGIRLLKADFHGSKGLIKGSFVMDQRNEGFRRFGSVAEALAAAR